MRKFYWKGIIISKYKRITFDKMPNGEYEIYHSGNISRGLHTAGLSMREAATFKYLKKCIEAVERWETLPKNTIKPFYGERELDDYEAVMEQVGKIWNRDPSILSTSYDPLQGKELFERVPEWMITSYYTHGGSWNGKLSPKAPEIYKRRFEAFNNKATSYYMRKEMAPQFENPYYKWDGSFCEDPRSITGIRERDIDLAIVRGIYENPEFLSKLCNKCGIDPFLIPELHLLYAKNSEYEFGKESDVVIELLTPFGKYIKIRIEDKIDAPFQKNQLEEYLERSSNDTWPRYYLSIVMLIAPKKYLDGVIEDDNIIKLSYEELFDMMMYSDDFSARMILCAINKQKKNIDPTVTSFWKDYIELYNTCATHLRSSLAYKGVPGAKGKNATWLTFKTGIKGTKIIHKADEGKIVLELNKNYFDYDMVKACKSIKKKSLFDGNKTFTVEYPVKPLIPQDKLNLNESEMALICKTIRNLYQLIPRIQESNQSSC